MKVYFFLLLSVAALSSILLALMLFLSFSSMKDLEKYSPFECGFLGYEESRSPFSVHFFIVSLIFLIFDVELILIFPYVSALSSSYGLESFFILFFFLLVLSLGLFIEWEKSMLEWLN